MCVFSGSSDLIFVLATEGDWVQCQHQSEGLASHGTPSLLPLPAMPRLQPRGAGEEVTSPTVGEADAGLHHSESVQPPQHDI